MSTNEIVTTIIDTFAEKLIEEKIDSKIVEKVKAILTDGTKTSAVKLESVLYEENDDL